MITIKMRFTANEDYNKVKAIRSKFIADNPELFNENSCNSFELIEV